MTQEEPAPPDEPFEYGDRTLFHLRHQPFDVAEEYGTMITRVAAPPEVALPIPAPVVESADDRMRRMEMKLDATLRLIAAMQQRLDSIDGTVARAITR